MWPFTLPKSAQIRIETLEQRSVAVENLLESFTTVYRDVFDGSVFKKIESDLDVYAEKLYDVHRKDVSDRMSDVKSKIADVEQYMKSLSVSLEAIRGLDRDIERLVAENKRIEAENKRIEQLIEKCRKDIDHYRFEDTGFGEFIDREQQAAIFDTSTPPALEDPDASISALAHRSEVAESGAPIASSRPDNLASEIDFDGLLPTRSLEHRLSGATGSTRHTCQSKPPPVASMPAGHAYQPATGGLADVLEQTSMQRAIGSLSAEAPRAELPPPPHSMPSRPRKNAFADFVDTPASEFTLIANDSFGRTLPETSLGLGAGVGVGVVTSLGAPVAVTIPGSS